MAIENGTVIDNIELGRIKPAGGGANVNFGPQSLRPAGYWPAIGEAVEFKRYANFASWAKYVRAI